MVRRLILARSLTLEIGKKSFLKWCFFMASSPIQPCLLLGTRALTTRRTRTTGSTRSTRSTRSKRRTRTRGTRGGGELGQGRGGGRRRTRRQQLTALLLNVRK